LYFAPPYIPRIRAAKHYTYASSTDHEVNSDLLRGIGFLLLVAEICLADIGFTTSDNLTQSATRPTHKERFAYLIFLPAVEH
jgi:hypothetical protein